MIKILLEKAQNSKHKIKTSFKNEIESNKEQIKNLKLDLKESEKRIIAIENRYIREKSEHGFFTKNVNNIHHNFSAVFIPFPSI